MMPSPKSFLTMLVILAVAGAAWWAAGALVQRGYDRRDAIAQEDSKRVKDAITEERLKNTTDAKVREDALVIELAEQEERADAAQVALASHLKKQSARPYASKPASPPNSPNPSDTVDETYEPPLLGQSVLDAFTVRVLNDARTNHNGGAHSSASGLSDAEVEAAASAATQITGGDFADNDLQVVGLYHDLATRHDQLVDWVNAQCLEPSNQK